MAEQHPEAFARDLDYWTRQLQGLTALEAPTDRPRSAVREARGARLRRPLPAGVMDAVEEASRRQGVTPFMLLLTAFTSLLARFSGQDDIAVGTPIANRTRLEQEPLIGFFANTLVLRADLSGSPTFGEALRRVRETALDAYAHQELPFEKLVEALHPAREMSRLPLFQVMFVLQNVPVELPVLAGARLEPVLLHSGAAQADIVLHVGRDFRGGHLLTLEYDTDLFDEATMAAFADAFVTLLSGSLQDPGRRILELPVLTPDVRRRLLVDWNATRRDFPLDRQTVVSLFERQAEAAPDAIAVTCAGEAIDYRTLAARSRRLAGYLRSLGAGPGSLVGICLERSADLVVALFGILETGAAYLPLDPAFPPRGSPTCSRTRRPRWS